MWKAGVSFNHFLLHSPCQPNPGINDFGHRKITWLLKNVVFLFLHFTYRQINNRIFKFSHTQRSWYCHFDLKKHKIVGKIFVMKIWIYTLTYSSLIIADHPLITVYAHLQCGKTLRKIWLIYAQNLGIYGFSRFKKIGLTAENKKAHFFPKGKKHKKSTLYDHDPCMLHYLK